MTASPSPSTNPPPPPLRARAAAVYDATAHRFLFMLNGNREMPMASLTKMMTALIALRDEHDDTSIDMVIPKAVRSVYGEMAYLTPGNTFTFHQLLLAMLLQSDNDAAVAVAVNVAGSQAAFVKQMNAEAKTLGLTETHFVNVHGLDAPGHYSSAHDLALLGAAAMKDPVFRRIVATVHGTIPWHAKHSVRRLTNENRLLTTFPGATGIKTGYTSLALNCVVASANAGGREVIAVVMGEGPRQVWIDESALLHWGVAVAPTLPLPPPPPTATQVIKAAVVRAPVAVAPRRAAGQPRWPWLAGIALCGLAAVLARRSRRRRRWRWRPPWRSRRWDSVPWSQLRPPRRP